MKQRTLYIVITATIFIIFAFAFVMVLLIKENSRCVAEPLVYGARHIETNDFLLCSCQVGLQSFYFDKAGMYRENPLLSNITERG